LPVSASGQDSKKRAAADSLKAEKETRYLAFQIFTYSPDPTFALSGEGKETPGMPDKASLLDYTGDIKRRIAPWAASRLDWPSCWDASALKHDDAEITRFIELAFSFCP